MFQIVSCFAGLLAAAQAMAGEPPPLSAAYCLRQGSKNFTFFAAKVMPDGRLKFGLDKWQGDRPINVTGFAEKQGDSWVSSRNVTPGHPDAGCIFIIRLNPAGVTTLNVDPSATCVGNDPTIPEDFSPVDANVGIYGGGPGTFINEVLPRSTFKGYVTTELDDILEFPEFPTGLGAKCARLPSPRSPSRPPAGQAAPTSR